MPYFTGAQITKIISELHATFLPDVNQLEQDVAIGEATYADFATEANISAMCVFLLERARTKPQLSDKYWHYPGDETQFREDVWNTVRATGEFLTKMSRRLPDMSVEEQTEYMYSAEKIDLALTIMFTGALHPERLPNRITEQHSGYHIVNDYINICLARK